jgi:hypothetical protein
MKTIYVLTANQIETIYDFTNKARTGELSAYELADAVDNVIGESDARLEETW